MDDVHGITSGSQYLSPTGRIWTVRGTTPSGTRLELTSQGPDGEHLAVMDAVAVLRMVRIDQSTPLPAADVERTKTSEPNLASA